MNRRFQKPLRLSKQPVFMVFRELSTLPTKQSPTECFITNEERAEQEQPFTPPPILPVVLLLLPYHAGTTFSRFPSTSNYPGRRQRARILLIFPFLPGSQSIIYVVCLRPARSTQSRTFSDTLMTINSSWRQPATISFDAKAPKDTRT